MDPQLEVSRDISASPKAVYAVISDVTRMGDWSDECFACELHEGYDAPVAGATFDGHNRNGDRQWTSQGKVIEADPGRAFAFKCSMFGFRYSTWGYRIEAAEYGSRVTESTVDLRSEGALELSREISGVADRADRARSAERRTLERLAAAVEQ